MPPGSYKVLVTYGQGWGGWWNATTTSFTTKARATTYTAVSSKITVPLRIPPTPVQSGRLTFPDGTPAAGYAVDLQDAQHNGHSTTTRSDGTWRIVVPGGNYRIEFAANGRGGSDWRAYYSSDGPVGSESRATWIDARHANSGLGVHVPRVLRIAGRAVDGAGHALAGVVVQVYRDWESPSGTDPTATARTDSTGHFSLRLSPNRWQFTFTDPSGSHVTQTRWLDNISGDRLGVVVTMPHYVHATGTVSVAIGVGGMNQDANGWFAPDRVTWRTSLDGKGTTYVLGGKWDISSGWSEYVTDTARWYEDRLATKSGRRYRVMATNAAGSTSSWIEGRSYRASYRQENESVTYAGTWTPTTAGSPWMGSLRYATTAGAKASTRFTATSVGWVGSVGPDRGNAAVYLDGTKVATVSLYAKHRAATRVVWASGPLTAGTHTVEIRALGTHAPASTGNRIDLDGFAFAAPI